ncbi:TetR/AcrR family transcriptional regulator [Flocculibacter collagenilyticus]|uniref:TetR/AcrR family transcriptional regulator n=1 Tax=Flocculibacter collagenilyticus TaxID=2744479 RepID=UPI0018F59F91|nr:TetR/AcrR family transcriptional regulator [Flocculibacter collagenilyticus]
MNFCKREKNQDEKCLIGKLTSKRQQTIADREQELLKIAEAVMEREGFAGLTMDKLVAACDYSKGTVYNHFNSKEDLLCALCIKGLKLSLQLCKKTLAFEGSSRERSLAVHYAYRLHSITHPTLFFCILTAKTPAVREKASEHHLKQQELLEKEMAQFCEGSFKEAVEKKELNISMGMGFNSYNFANWAMSFGSNALLMVANETETLRTLDHDMAILHNLSLLMDGMGWRPLSSEWDYLNTWQRIKDEVFAEEVAALSR